jgi:hypothetical protein
MILPVELLPPYCNAFIAITRWNTCSLGFVLKEVMLLGYSIPSVEIFTLGNSVSFTAQTFSLKPPQIEDILSMDLAGLLAAPTALTTFGLSKLLVVSSLFMPNKSSVVPTPTAFKTLSYRSMIATLMPTSTGAPSGVEHHRQLHVQAQVGRGDAFSLTDHPWMHTCLGSKFGKHSIDWCASQCPGLAHTLQFALPRD